MYPFERFTERSKKVLTLAQEEAERGHHSYIGTEHLLLGLMRETDGLAAQVLESLGLNIETVRVRIQAVLGRNERIIIQQIIPTSRVKKVIEISFEEARRMGHNYVGTEHLLIGLLLEGEGIAAHVLMDLGATLDKVRSQVARFLATSGPEAAAGAPTPAPAPKPYDDAVTAILNAAGDAAEKEHATVFRLDHLLSAIVGRRSAPPGALDLLRASGVNLDVLRKMLRPPPRLRRLEAALEDTRQKVAKAAADQHHDLLPKLRQEETSLRDQAAKALASWQASWGAP